jgi:hypothetical protein
MMGISRYLTLFIGVAVLGAAASATLAQTKKAPADIQKSYDLFISEFRKAMKANSSEAVAALTKLPFQGDPKMDAAQFRKTMYGEVFTAKVRSCIQRGKGVYDLDGEKNHNFFIFCGNQIFTFARTPEGFRFTDVGVND